MVRVNASFLVALSGVVTCLCTGVLAASPGNVALLDALKPKLLAAQKLPVGSRPVPPQQDLSSLPGVHVADVIRRLGPPSYCTPPGSHGCEHASSIRYEWGPKPPPATVVADGENEVIAIVTGGPYLLVFELERDVVKSVRWEGQR